MILLAEIVLGLSILGLFHSYFFYPLLLRRLAGGKPGNSLVYQKTDELPFVSVIMSVYNEEKVIEEKLLSLLGQDYPPGKMQVYVGSDCSTDATDMIVSSWALKEERIRFFPFRERRGKPRMLNELVALAFADRPADPGHALLITDANVILSDAVVYELVKHFRNERMAFVDAHMVHTGMKSGGISRAENIYIASEVLLKHYEGLVWGKMIGPFGGCYALRSTYFTEVPDTFLVDDFYIAMRSFERGGDAINDLKAVCFEAVSHEIREEYRRKARISAGNFQNLVTFRHLWWPPFRPLAFAFFSHKVLRWLGPFLLAGILVTLSVLALTGNLFFRTLLSIMVIGITLLPAIDYGLKFFGINILPLRGLRYFLIMNLALLEGFIKFVKGIESNVWEPPKRQ